MTHADAMDAHHEQPGPRICVAVCTNRPPEAVRECLAALAPQLAASPRAEALLVTSGLAGAEAEALAGAARAQLGDRVRHEAMAEPGLARARNRALAACGGAGVLAFLDDDAVAAPGWLARLEARWREAPEDVGCIGGRILPRWPGGGRPAWLTDRLTPILTLLELGGGLHEVDPERTTVWGANLSFRVSALREAGGFDERLGVVAGLPLFSEECEAERRLARRGYRVLYAGDVVVEHVIPAERLSPRELARRRYFYGVTLGLLDRRSKIVAAGRSLKAAAGTAVAAAAGREALRAERLVRAAENGGVVTAPLARRYLRRRGWTG